ncbi:hypothetical protein PLESTF_001825900 [Pleodorina starrii]|nr:hypothetical protein PLESTF_001825900 [Pleodorina starrii]
MALSSGHSTRVPEDESAVISGHQRIKHIPADSLRGTPQPRQPGGSDAGGGGGGGGLLRRLCRALPRPRLRWRSREQQQQQMLEGLPGGYGRRRRREAARQAAEVEAVVLGAPARGWPREDVPGLYSALTWLVTRMAAGAVAAAALSPIGPMAAAVAKVTSGFAGGRLGYRFGRRLDRVEVAHVQQYLQDLRDGATAVL